MSIPIFHITDFSNLDAILSRCALLSKTLSIAEGTRFQNISHASIQNVRAVKSVPISPKGTFHDYVPFYFATRSPMLYALHQGSVEGYKKGQAEIIYLQSSAEIVHEAGKEYVFTNRNASLANADFFNDISDFSTAIDTTILKETIWANTADDGDRKARRQAEFLVKDIIEIDKMLGIGVFDEAHRKQVADRLAASAFPNIKSAIKRSWYF